jgi:hypothetical protein
MSEVLLINDHGTDAERILIQRIGVRDRLDALVRSSELDRRLAAGVPPGFKRRADLRARRLLLPLPRRRMASSLRRLVHDADRPRASVCVPSRPSMCSTLEKLADRLDGTQPVDVRGVALTRLLLTDGAGLLYFPHGEAEVTTAVATAMAALDPVSGVKRDR